MQFIIKIFISAFVIASVSELAKRFTIIAAIVASLPLTSILAFIWLYYDTKNTQQIINLSSGIFWAVLPSLLFFAALIYFLKSDVGFGWSMIISSFIMFVGYIFYYMLLNKFGIKI